MTAADQRPELSPQQHQRERLCERLLGRLRVMPEQSAPQKHRESLLRVRLLLLMLSQRTQLSHETSKQLTTLPVTMNSSMACNGMGINILCMIKEELDTMSTKCKELCRCFCQEHSSL